MKKLFSLLVLFLVSVPVMAGPTVAFSPKEQKAEQGEAFAVDIVLREFPVTEGGGVSLRFDPDVVRATGVVLTGAWNFASDAGVIDNEAGAVNDIVFAAFPGVSGNLPVATVWFEAIGRGKTRLRIMPSEKNPFAGGGMRIPAEFERGKVKVVRSRHEHEHRDGHRDKHRDEHDEDDRHD